MKNGRGGELRDASDATIRDARQNCGVRAAECGWLHAIGSAMCDGYANGP